MSYGLDNLDGNYLQTTLAGFLHTGIVSISLTLTLALGFAGAVYVAIKRFWQ